MDHLRHYAVAGDLPGAHVIKLTGLHLNADVRRLLGHLHFVQLHRGVKVTLGYVIGPQQSQIALHAFRTVSRIKTPAVPDAGNGRRHAANFERPEVTAKILRIELGVAGEVHLLDANALAGIDVEVQVHFVADERHQVVIHGGGAEAVRAKVLLGLIGDLMRAQPAHGSAFGQVHLQTKGGRLHVEAVEQKLRHLHDVENDRRAFVFRAWSPREYHRNGRWPTAGGHRTGWWKRRRFWPTCVFNSTADLVPRTRTDLTTKASEVTGATGPSAKAAGREHKCRQKNTTHVERTGLQIAVHRMIIAQRANLYVRGRGGDNAKTGGRWGVPGAPGGHRCA